MYHIHVSEISQEIRDKKISSQKRRLKQALISPAISQQQKDQIKLRIRSLGYEKDYSNYVTTVREIDR